MRRNFNNLLVSLSYWLRTFWAPLKSRKENIFGQLTTVRTKISLRFQRSALIFAAMSTVFATVFMTYHALSITHSGYYPVEKAMSFGLLMSQLFFILTGLGYIHSIMRSRSYRSAFDQHFSAQSSSSVSCLLSVCDEPIETISETLASICAMRYDNKKVYVLDDSTKAENIKNVRSLAEEFNVSVIRRKDRRHYKAGNINNALKRIKSDYVALFDADQRPSPDFLKDIVPLLDEDSKVALVQTPQVYEDTHSFISDAAAISNSLFYGHIAESKDVSGAMFCCGTNCIIRVEALSDVGGFDTTTITEDFATTLKMHIRGWKTRYLDKKYVVGLGPETLGAYLKQYNRWATGTFQTFKAALKLLFANPKALSVNQWYEYWLCFSYYLSGLFNFYLLLLPTTIIMFDINLVRDDALMYLLFLSVYILAFWSFFLFTSIKKGYRARHLITVLARLDICKFYIYTKAFFAVLIGRKPSFEVTGKGNTGQVRWTVLAVPLAVLTLNAVTALIGLYRLGITFQVYLAVNTLWAINNVWQLSAVIQYNSSSKFQNRKFFSPFKNSLSKTPAIVPGELEVR